MLLADERTRSILALLTPLVQTLCDSYVGRLSPTMPVQQLVSTPMLKHVNAVLGTAVDATEFRRWVKFAVEQDRVALKVNHELMMQSGFDVPEWVYALLWAFNPKFAPTCPS